MTCVYRQKDGKITGEHLIPLALIDLFPECEFNIHRSIQYNDGGTPEPLTDYYKTEKVVINDVCEM